MIQYILECIAFQLVFLVIYDFFLKRETFFQWNRVYLLATFAASLVLPWVKIEAFKTDAPAILGYSEYLWNLQPTPIVGVGTAPEAMEITWPMVLFLVGCGMVAIAFVVKLWRLRNLKLTGTVQCYRDHRRILIPHSYAAFSFLKSIFLGEYFSPKETESIVAHELVHIRQWHTLDLLFFEVLRIVFWFNPLVYVYQNRLTELHEFIADAQVPKQERQNHCEMLLSQAFEVQNISFINPFFQSSLIKKRIVMLQKKRSKKIWQLKYLVLVPLVLGKLFYTSCESEANSKENLEATTLKSNMVTFSELDAVPIFPGCENSGDKRACFNQKIMEHISKNFNYPEEALEKNIEGQVSVMFTINTEGSIVNIQKRGPHPLLEEEVERIISKLPKMEPGLKDGKTVNIPYSIPVVFQLDGTSAQTIRANKALESNAIPFGEVDEVPVFPGCENATDSHACFNENIMLHISKNFSYPQEAKDRRIQGRVSALFTISKEGNVENIAMRGPDKLLEDEVERILKRLPVMKPGKNVGEDVAVAYSIPVNFKLE
ncbi:MULTISPECIES: M56 family metallopeptidase [Maribacter]|uniref:M56 family metallopeptidase n=1 Tax=Maribacter flavus TaxID=1658664 RepID=A0ABU7ID32_9FLAO|nr:MULTISPECIES: M56 family metallopeptidase [Maribacter]MDC6403716.1 M56 family metallopeptidase [Maribacter sp. PR66]MEE1970857.1 M56 family metallopeptidase [Maribacter flavus]